MVNSGLWIVPERFAKVAARRARFTIYDPQSTIHTASR